MTRVLNLSSYLVVLVLILVVGAKWSHALGGVISALLMWSIYSYLYFSNKLKSEMARINLMMALMWLINYLNFLDVSNVFPKIAIVVSYNIVHLLIISCVYSIVANNINHAYENVATHDLFNIGRNIRFIFRHTNLMGYYYIFVNSIVLIVLNENGYLNKPNIIHLIPIAYIFAIFGFIISFIRLYRMGNSLLNVAFAKDLQIIDLGISASKVKIYYVMLMGIIILLGIPIELLRHEWLLWVETLITINFGNFLTLFLYKYMTCKPDKELGAAIKDIQPIATFKSFLTGIILHAACGTLLMMTTLFIFVKLIGR
jgi:hypothetical protein